jgi:hypothetical protein
MRLGRSGRSLRHSRSQRRANEQADVIGSGWVGSGKKTPWIQNRARWEGVVEYWPVRRNESTIRVEKSSACPRSGYMRRRRSSRSAAAGEPFTEGFFLILKQCPYPASS